MTDIRREITFAELPDPVQQTVLQLSLIHI